MPTEDKKYVHIQILISLLTLLLTPFFSGVVVYFQLSKQHQLWVEQRKVIQSDDIHTKKIQLTSDLGIAYRECVTAMTTYYLNHMRSIALMARQEVAEDSKILFFDTLVKVRPSAEEFRGIEEQLLQNMTDYFGAERQFRSCLFLVSTTFSDDVASEVRVVEDSIKFNIPDANQTNELIPKYEKILAELQRTRDISQYNESVSEFTRTYLSNFLSKRNEKLSSAMSLLFASMRAERNIQ